MAEAPLTRSDNCEPLSERPTLALRSRGLLSRSAGRSRPREPARTAAGNARGALPGGDFRGPSPTPDFKKSQ
jgi:hypothetical protein